MNGARAAVLLTSWAADADVATFAHFHGWRECASRGRAAIVSEAQGRYRLASTVARAWRREERRDRLAWRETVRDGWRTLREHLQPCRCVDCSYLAGVQRRQAVAQYLRHVLRRYPAAFVVAGPVGVLP